MADAGERFLQQIESFFRAQHADRSDYIGGIRDGLRLAGFLRIELGCIDAVVAELDSFTRYVLVVNHVTAHGLAIDDNAVHDFVSPANLTAATRVEQAAV